MNDWEVVVGHRGAMGGWGERGAPPVPTYSAFMAPPPLHSRHRARAPVKFTWGGWGPWSPISNPPPPLEGAPRAGSLFYMFFMHISLGRAVSCQHGAFSGVGAFVVSFVPAECPVGGGGCGAYLESPLKRAIQNAQVCMLY